MALFSKYKIQIAKLAKATFCLFISFIPISCCRSISEETQQQKDQHINLSNSIEITPRFANCECIARLPTSTFVCVESFSPLNQAFRKHENFIPERWRDFAALMDAKKVTPVYIRKRNADEIELAVIYNDKVPTNTVDIDRNGNQVTFLGAMQYGFEPMPWGGRRSAFGHNDPRRMHGENSVMDEFHEFNVFSRAFFDTEDMKSNLKILDLSDSYLSKQNYDQISEFESLLFLALPRSGVDISSREFKMPKNVETLVVYNARLDDVALANIASLKRLKKLSLYGCWIDVEFQKDEKNLSEFLFGETAERVKSLTILNCHSNVADSVLVGRWHNLEALTVGLMLPMSVILDGDAETAVFPSLREIHWIFESEVSDSDVNWINSLASKNESHRRITIADPVAFP